MEVHLQEYCRKNLADVRILYFTASKHWQCAEIYKPQTAEEMAVKCNEKGNAKKSDPLCYCREAYRWWNFLREVKGESGA